MYKLTLLLNGMSRTTHLEIESNKPFNQPQEIGSFRLTKSQARKVRKYNRRKKNK